MTTATSIIPIDGTCDTRYSIVREEFERNFRERGEVGVAGGNGFTRNCPILPGKDDEAYREALDTQLAPEMARFNPQVILLSTGFDAHRDDEMSDMRVTTDGFTHMAQTVFQWAEAYAGGRLLSILEGGYCLERLPELAANHVRVLLDA